jgi:lactate racemase
MYSNTVEDGYMLPLLYREGVYMTNLEMKYGNEKILVSIPEKNMLGVIEGNKNSSRKTETEVILDALNNPIGSRKLEEIVSPGETVCIIISDITRAWQKMSLFLPYIVEKLNSAGVRDEDITFLSATGSHRKQSGEEHEVLLGGLSKRFKVIDHDCRDLENMVYIGETSFKTPVYINRVAFDADHIVLTGAIVFHDLAGWSGGKKSLVPGISGYETIMKNHSLSLSPCLGEGINPAVKGGNITNNPVHLDMQEAAGFAHPSFMFNVIIDGEGNISGAVAGDFIKAHAEGCKLVDEADRAYINSRADLVIASAGGFPKDIDLYQASKSMVNAKEALKLGGTIILLSECPEGVGHPEVEVIIQGFENNQEREKELRRSYTIAKFSGFLVTNIAENYEIILVSSIDEGLIEKANIKVVRSFEEAIKMVHSKIDPKFKAYLMPNASSTLPMLQE